MLSKNLVGKCGLYCGACTIFRAEKDSAEWRSQLADSFHCSPDQVRCNGCGALTDQCWGSGCKIVLCLSSKGFDYCYECDTFKSGDCDKFESLASRYLESSNFNLRDSLKMIEAGQTDLWLQAAKDRFSCVSCGNPVVAGAKKCHHCKSDIL